MLRRWAFFQVKVLEMRKQRSRCLPFRRRAIMPEWQDKMAKAFGPPEARIFTRALTELVLIWAWRCIFHSDFTERQTSQEVACRENSCPVPRKVGGTSQRAAGARTWLTLRQDPVLRPRLAEEHSGAMVTVNSNYSVLLQSHKMRRWGFGLGGTAASSVQCT